MLMRLACRAESIIAQRQVRCIKPSQIRIYCYPTPVNLTRFVACIGGKLGSAKVYPYSSETSLLVQADTE